MSSRIEIEITSRTDSEDFNWRALGAREPKGTIKGSLLPSNVEIGDSFRVEADFHIDGIEILRVVPKKDIRKDPETLKIFGTKNEDFGVTTQLVKKNRSKQGKKRKPKDRKKDFTNRKKSQSKQGRPSGDGEKKKIRRTGAPNRGKRLKAKRSHRNAFVATLPELHKPLANELLRGGIPSLRKTMKKMALPEGFDTEILQYAEKVNTQLRTAEWHDKADAVLQSAKEIDLRDFRSVVAAGGQWARSEELSSVQSQLETALRERLELEHGRWLTEIEKAISDGKSVRALNLSSHPPKPGTLLPEHIMSALVNLANTSLDGETSSHRWSVVVQAVAYSPVRLKVVPIGIPSKPTKDLLSVVKKNADRIPDIAALFPKELDQ